MDGECFIDIYDGIVLWRSGDRLGRIEFTPGDALNSRGASQGRIRPVHKLPHFRPSDKEGR